MNIPACSKKSKKEKKGQRPASVVPVLGSGGQHDTRLTRQSY